MSRLADKIRSARDYNSETYEIPEWDVEVEIRSLTAAARSLFVEKLQQQASQGLGTANLVSALIVGSCYDPETGEPVFGPDDAEWLMGEKSGAVVDRLATQCLKVSGLKDDAVDDAGKDSSASPTVKDESTENEGSTSSSPES